MKFTYEKLQGLQEGVRQNLINEAGQKLNRTLHDDFNMNELPELEATRLMSLTIAFKGFQMAFQGIDDYTDYIIAGVHEKELERTPELKAELENMAEIINTDVSNAYLKMVPYVMTDKEIQTVIDKGLTAEQQAQEILDKLIDKFVIGAGKDAEEKEIGGGRKVKIIPQESIEQELDKAIEQTKDKITEEITSQIKGDKEASIADILQILFQSK